MVSTLSLELYSMDLKNRHFDFTSVQSKNMSISKSGDDNLLLLRNTLRLVNTEKLVTKL